MDVATSDEEAPPSHQFALHPGYPNPFAEEARIPFEITAETNAPVELAVFDVEGRRVATLLHRVMPPGRHEVRWDGTDHTGRRLAAGRYFYVLRHGSQTHVRTLVLIR